jgi:hypothetical protein
VELIANNAYNFYIRNISSAKFNTQCGTVKNSKKIEINNEIIEVATIIYTPFDDKFSYRVVVRRSIKKNQQIDFESETAYNYYGIMTNNLLFFEKEIIEFYNKRGDSENSNKLLISDFNLARLPFMDLDTNTVFMYLMAMSLIIFEWTKIILVK